MGKGLVMRMRSIIMLGLAAILGIGAVTLARGWIAGQISEKQVVQVVQPVRPQIEITMVVVARTALRFGNRVTEQHIKEVEWPASAVPPGAFGSIEEFLTDEDRVVLQAMEENEPILAGKVTGGGERASLSAIIEPGMRAVTIRVNDVLGVAGFVLPGDRVDIMLTREVDDSPITDVLLQSVKVLGIDQDANERRNEPGVARSMTLEVSTEQAQKLTLASRVGSLSLALRNIANTDTEIVKRVMLSDLNIGEANGAPGEPAVVQELAAVEPEPVVEEEPEIVRVVPNPMSKIAITRGLTRKEYNVDPEDRPEGQPFSILPDLMYPTNGSGVDGLGVPLPLLPAALEDGATNSSDAASDQDAAVLAEAH